MEKINKEIIISSLFSMGFDKVDALLYMYVLDDLFRYIDVIKKFEYDLIEPTSTFNKYVDFDGMVSSLKKGYTLNTKVSCDDGSQKQLRKVLNINYELVQYLEDVDFAKIVNKKVFDIGLERLEEFSYLFSNVEREYIYNAFQQYISCYSGNKDSKRRN